MTHYTVMRWSSADADAAHTAERATRRLRETGWWLAIDEPGWCVALDRATPVARLRTCAEGRAIVIGSLFDRAATELGRDPTNYPPRRPDRFSRIGAHAHEARMGRLCRDRHRQSRPGDDVDLPRSGRRARVRHLDGRWPAYRLIGARGRYRRGTARRAPESTGRMVVSPARLPGHGRRRIALSSDSRPCRRASSTTVGRTVRWRRGSGIQRRHCSLHPAAMEEPERRLAWLVDSCVAAWCSEIRQWGRRTLGRPRFRDHGCRCVAHSGHARSTAGSIIRATIWPATSAPSQRAVADHLDLPLTTSVRAGRQLELHDVETMPVAARPGLGSTSLFHDR